MSWLRLEDGIGDHPKILKLARADRWTWIELLSYCARHQTDGHIPNEIGESRRYITNGFLRKCVDAGLIDQTENGLTVHDWDHFNPTKDPTNAIRQQRYRNARRNANVTENVTGEVTPSRARPQPRSRPVPRESSSLSPDERYVTDDAAPHAEADEAARRDAWLARSVAPDVRSPAAFINAGMASGSWPDPFVPVQNVNGPVTAPACEVCGIGGGVHAADCEHAQRVEALAGVLEEQRQEEEQHGEE
jgi:hypothetical protein